MRISQICSSSHRGDQPKSAHRISSRAKKAAAFEDLLLLFEPGDLTPRLFSLGCGQPGIRSRRSRWSCLSHRRNHDSAILSSAATSRIGLSPGGADRSLAA
jgi:hypothetical protein